MNDFYEQAILEGANSPATLPETLNRWAEAGSKAVQLAVARNPSTSFSTLVILSRGNDPFISRVAIASICRSVATESIAA